MVQHVESFYGVYLLYNVNPKFKGRTYIGFTVDPNRRVKQHNTGKHAGGAWRTSGKGPWEMVLITHGFPNEISALRFEWAWQNPEKSRRLRHLSKKTRKETAYEYRLRILSEMLRTGPWHRLSLTVRWLIQSYQRDFPPDSSPPIHMAIAYGPVKAVKVKGAPSNRGKAKKTTDITTEVDLTAVIQTDIASGGELDIATETMSCSLCQSQCNSRDLARCYHPDCGLEVHLTCLSGHMLRNDAGGHVIPVSGACPRCGQELLWGDIIRHKQGCFLNLKADEELEENHWANELTS